MKTPRSRNEQRMTHCRGEVQRGCGVWPYLGPGCPLEPPFEPYSWKSINKWDLIAGSFDAPYQGRFIERLQRLFLPTRAKPLDLRTAKMRGGGPLNIVLFRHYRDDDVTFANVEQLLLALGAAREPLAFELFGIGPSGHAGSGPPRIETRFVAGRTDLPLVKAQLHNLYPRSAVESHQMGFHESDHQFKSSLLGGPNGGDSFFASSCRLEAPYCFPIRTFGKADTDPLAALIAVMERLGKHEWALLQVLFCRARHSWAENLRLACEDPYQPKHLLVPGLDPKTLSTKLHTPLFAASITLATNRQHMMSNMTSFVHQYEGPHNRLTLRNQSGRWSGDEFPQPDHWRNAILSRQVLTPGILVNLQELAGIVHIPSAEITSDRLLRVTSPTRQPPAAALNARFVAIGQNAHRGQVNQVAIPADLRARHCYIAGATGTGKSTLLTNLMVQDIAAGHGVGLLDPHGDLVKVILRHIPRNRIDDVVLFDAADTDFPFALNILEARDEAERERIVAETIMALERYFPASWGPRLERILQYTIRTVLHTIPGATLADVERLLTDTEFRETTLQRTTDPRLLNFWNTQFKFFPKNATDPVLNKLSVFLLDRHVRNIICQRRAAVNFDNLLNQGKILLANLSTGLLTEKVAGTLGSFLVTKIVNAAFRRAALPPDQRRPWHLYIDEFQNFVNLSVGFERILAEARKQALTLTAANQHVGQLNQAVRQAIFGNVGSLIVFRLGIEDAQTVSRELGAFTAQDILNLDVGQAIARVGGSGASFNLATYKEPSAPFDNPSQWIIALARQRYAKPRLEVERELAQVARAAERLPVAAQDPEEPNDPSEDDLVT
ncbi:MAG TPA: type IV secretion system DNA-binding domain-containing protein [Gemmataceae bacterium]|jgi:hypothetical protein